MAQVTLIDEQPTTQTPDEPAPAPAAAPAAVPDAVPPLPTWAAVLAAAVAGGAMLVAFPPYGLWWAAPAAVALLAIATHRRRLRGGFGLGVLAGALFFTPLLSWTNLHTGLVP